MTLDVLARVRGHQHRQAPVYRVRCRVCGVEYQRVSQTLGELARTVSCKSCAAKRRIAAGYRVGT